MKTRLISYTSSVGSLNDLSLEQIIVYCARVSNPTNQHNSSTSDKLIRYLIKHKHWSPFEMVHVTFEISTSRAIAAQILRHRSFSFQEFSQRYSKATSMRIPEIRKQSQKNRQGGEEEITDNDLNSLVTDSILQCKKTYDELIEKGVAKECARMVLPLCTDTTMYMCGSVRSWIHYLQLRCDASTQKEHRDIANEIKNTLTKLIPSVMKEV